MSGINVSSTVLRQYRQLLEEARESINLLLYCMIKKMRNVEGTWNDKNYRRLETILAECVMNLKEIYEVIVAVEKYLDDLYVSVLAYEESNLGYINVNRVSISVNNNLNQRQMGTLKAEIASIDRTLLVYKQELLARGVIDGAMLALVLKHYRNQLQVDMLRGMNGEYMIPRSAPDFNIIAANIQRNDLNNYIGSTTPRNLIKTRYGYQKIVFNGREMNVYNDPIGTSHLLIKTQGTSRYQMKGTCGLCQSANILTMAGIITTEEDIISIALRASDNVLLTMDLFESDLNDRGGTTPLGRKEILESQGIPVVNVPVNVDRNQTIRWLASMVASGHGVILSVDVEYLWRNGQSGGHAISLLSVTSDGSEFIYSDTGRGTIDTISAENLARVLTGRPINVTKNIIR